MSISFSLVQNQIISKLKNAKSLKYSELKPDSVANDLFNYHLQFLVKKGLIEKIDQGYCLSETGIKYVADPNTFGDSINSLFKINVITVVSRINNGSIEILNQIRTSHPSYGKTSTMGGITLKGELIEDSASRKLEAETGLLAKLKLLGIERRILYKGHELFSDIMFPITYTDSFSGDLLEETEYGKNIWVPIDDAIKNESAEFDSIISIVKILKSVKNGTLSGIPFFFTENVQSDK